MLGSYASPVFSDHRERVCADFQVVSACVTPRVPPMGLWQVLDSALKAVSLIRDLSAFRPLEAK